MGKELIVRTKRSLPGTCKPILDTLITRGKDFDKWSVGKLPIITTEIKQAALQAKVLIAENLTPANPEGIKAAIFTLLQHYYVSDLPEQIHQAIASDWMRCLEKYPAWAIEAARIDWLQNNKRKPTPSEMGGLCDKAVSKDKAMLRQCERIIKEPLTPEPEPEMTDEEREAMKKRISDIVAKAKREL